MDKEKFDEQAYLRANPDVRAAVLRGSFESGWEHYQKSGQKEGRPGAVKSPISGRHVFFCHIPKTAGTSLRKALEGQFEPHQILPDDRMMQRAGGQYAPIDIVLETLRHSADKVRLIRGHYHLDFRKFLTRPIVISVLRDPRQRTISNLKHLVRNGRPVENILGSLDRGILPIPDNKMTRCLGAESDLKPDESYTLQNANLTNRAKIADGKRRVESAIENLSSIQVLGITEDLESFRDALNLAGLDFEPGVRLNRIKTELPLSASHLDFIDEQNALDIELYAAAKKILADRGGKITL